MGFVVSKIRPFRSLYLKVGPGVIGKHPEPDEESMIRLAEDATIEGTYQLDSFGTLHFATRAEILGGRFHKGDDGRW